MLLSRIAQGLLGFTFFAFAIKALVHTDVQVRYTPLVIFHAGAMLAWFSLLASQAFLAARHRLNLHRALGRASITLVGAMAASGALIAVNIGQELGRPEVTVVNIAAFVTFIPLYLAALQFGRRRDMHAHRQAMLIATLALMTPAYARVVQVLGLPDPVAIGVQVPITVAIAVGYDWATQGRVTKPVMAMLAFSVAVIAVMAAVLAVWFL
jgi:hypothetical protein